MSWKHRYLKEHEGTRVNKEELKNFLFEYSFPILMGIVTALFIIYAALTQGPNII